MAGEIGEARHLKRAACRVRNRIDFQTFTALSRQNGNRPELVAKNLYGIARRTASNSCIKQ